MSLGEYQLGNDSWKLFNRLKKLRKGSGVDSVRIIITSNWMASATGFNLVSNGFHRYPGLHNTLPVCLTRYPYFPRGCRRQGKGHGKGAQNQWEPVVKQRFEHHGKDFPRHWEVVVEINCRSDVLPDVIKNFYDILDAQNHATP